MLKPLGDGRSIDAFAWFSGRRGRVIEAIEQPGLLPRHHDATNYDIDGESCRDHYEISEHRYPLIERPASSFVSIARCLSVLI
jgi:hypothetical protein